MSHGSCAKAGLLTAGPSLADTSLGLASWHAPARTRQTGEPEHITRVLLVEEDMLQRRIARVLLSNPRVALVEVSNGQAAIDLLAIKPFDLILLGQPSAMMTAEETIRWVRGSCTPWADIAILVMLDASLEPGAGQLMAAGATDWTPRPVERDAFINKLVALMPALHDAGL